jgi:tetratricopeptide (TPR) repeat protein
VYRPEDDWFAHANHARSAAMIPHDHYRSPDSFGRQAGMEAAVRKRLGALTPTAATEILRDRSGHRYPNDNSIANLFVLNAAVVQPAAGLLWHSTSMQPSAPFGAYRAFAARAGAPELPALPAAPALAEPQFHEELEAIAEARAALRAQRAAAVAGDAEERRAGFAESLATWNRLASAEPPLLDPARIALARAHALHGLGDLEGAFAALAPAEAEGAPFEVRAEGLASRALLADRLGRREEALRLWRATLRQLEAGPEFNVFEDLRALAEAGLAEPASDDELPFAWWDVGLPR